MKRTDAELIGDLFVGIGSRTSQYNSGPTPDTQATYYHSPLFDTDMLFPLDGLWTTDIASTLMNSLGQSRPEHVELIVQILEKFGSLPIDTEISPFRYVLS